MKNKNVCPWLACIALAVSQTGCLSPKEHFYTLEAPVMVPQSGGRDITVVVGPVTFPGFLDRPQLVVREGKYMVNVLEQERWATPLKEALPRAFAEALNQNDPRRRFVTLSSPAVATVNGRIIVDISHLDLIRHVGVHLTAHWIYRPSDTNAPLSEGDANAQVPSPQRGDEGLVEALQRAITQISGDIAKHLPA